MDRNQEKRQLDEERLNCLQSSKRRHQPPWTNPAGQSGTTRPGGQIVTKNRFTTPQQTIGHPEKSGSQVQQSAKLFLPFAFLAHRMGFIFAYSAYRNVGSL
jgi:hypothetical protein